MIKKILFILLFTFNLYAIEQYNDTTLYFFTSDHSVTIAWDEVLNATNYDLYLWSIERNTKAVIANTPTNEITLKVPRTGHYIIYVRASIPSEEIYSDYVSSMNAENSSVEIDGTQVNKGWFIYGFIAPPSSGSIIIQ